MIFNCSHSNVTTDFTKDTQLLVFQLHCFRLPLNMIHKTSKREEKQMILDKHYHCIDYLTNSFAQTTFQKFETNVIYWS